VVVLLLIVLSRTGRTHNIDLDTATEEDIPGLLMGGHTIDAIKVYRRLHDVDLKAAGKAVERLAAGLPRSTPAQACRFRGTGLAGSWINAGSTNRDRRHRRTCTANKLERFDDQGELVGALSGKLVQPEVLQKKHAVDDQRNLVGGI
jgi:hypothetical protein